MQFPFPITVTVATPTSSDLGTPTYGAQRPIAGCAHCPRDTTEVLDMRDTVVTDEWLWGPVDAQITAADGVWLPGDDTGKPPPWQVQGRPQLYRDHPFTDDPEAKCFQAVIRRVD